MWADDKVDQFRSDLHPSYVDDFDNRYREELDKFSIENKRRELKNKLQAEEDHLDLIIAAASAFHQDPLAAGYDSGYRFAFTEPLEELNPLGIQEEASNGDVLLVKEDGPNAYLCIIECKSGRFTGGEWIHELKDIRDTAELKDNTKRLKDQLGIPSKEVQYIQYVLLAKIVQVHGINFDRISDSVNIPEDFAFWGCDMGDFSIVNVHGRVNDRDLSRFIEQPIDALKIENPIKFTLNDHPLIQLKRIIGDLIDSKTDENDPEPLEFWEWEFREQFNDGLQIGVGGDHRSELVNRRVKRLLEIGEKIEILVTTSDKLNTDRDYRIYFQGSKSSLAKTITEEKYLDTLAEESVKESVLGSLRKEFEVMPEQMDITDEDWF